VIVEGERTFAAPRATVWQVLNDPASMARTMPGVESFDIHDDRRWTANVKIPLGLGGLKMKVDMEKTEEREPEFASMSIKGQGVGAMMNMQTRFELSESDGGTTMKWAADVKIAGPVGSMGQRVLQPIVNQQVQHVLGALDKQVMEAKRGGAQGSASQASGSQGSGDSAGSAGGTSPAPSTSAAAPPAEGPKDYGPPADADADAEPDSGTSGAEEGISPISDEPYEKD
jgi:carbon monoxide dehydrogenase subunit G